MLFKVDYCWQRGLATSSVTSRPCTWVVGGKAPVLEPTRVKDLVIQKPRAGRPGKMLKHVGSYFAML